MIRLKEDLSNNTISLAHKRNIVFTIHTEHLASMFQEILQTKTLGFNSLKQEIEALTIHQGDSIIDQALLNPRLSLASSTIFSF